MSPSARKIRPLAGLLIAMLAVACTGKAPATTTPSSPRVAKPAPSSAAATAAPSSASLATSSDAWLVVGRTELAGLRVILASTNGRLMDLPTGVPDATWNRLVSASTSGGTTTVSDLAVEPELGGPTQTIDGAWRLPTLGADPTPVGVSADGGTIVLVEDGVRPAAAAPTTRFAILRRTFEVKPRIVELTGAFEYDTLSPDGSILFVVEHLPAPPEGHYQVRAVETATGTLRDGAVADKNDVDEAMAGRPIAQTRRPDGMVYTLYQGIEHPFVHALSSIDSWAICIDLPPNDGDATASLDWGLAVNPNGTSLITANATLGLASEIPFADLAVRRSVSFAPSATTSITLAKFGHQAGGAIGRRLVASPAGSVLYAGGSGGIVRLDASDLSVTGHFLEGVAVDALAVTPDGATIYTLVHARGRIVKLDAGSGQIVGQVPGEGFDRLVAVVPM